MMSMAFIGVRTDRNYYFFIKISFYIFGNFEAKVFSTGIYATFFKNYFVYKLFHLFVSVPFFLHCLNIIW